MRATEHLNLKAFFWAGVILSGLAFVAIVWLLDRNIASPWDIAKTVPMVVTIDWLAWEVFRRWAWSWKRFYPWLRKTPDLRGEWVGEIRPNDNHHAPGEPAPVIEAKMTVRQTLTDIVCVARTGEMRSASFIAGFRCDEEQDLKQLSYSYQSIPKSSVRDRSAMHFGTVLLECRRDGDRWRLVGEYWSSRKTVGEIEFWRSK